ncbi:MAG: hypothetical protein M0Z31_06605 [Clostridia bacterium]|nr:hypothetical protein [Clostridia bacterium]
MCLERSERKSWNITVPGATKIRVHFSRISTERWYDYVYTSAADSYSGDLTNVWSGWIYGDTAKVTIITDGATIGWGFQIDKVEYYTGTESNWKVSELYQITHAASDNESKLWTISKPGAKAIRVHFKDIDIEKNYDVLNIGTTSTTYPDIWTDKIHGSRSGVWSSWFPGDEVYLRFISDGSIPKRGFKIDRIEYMTSTQSDFPWTNIQYNPVGYYEVNPDFGDAQRRLADRLLHLPDQGTIKFSEDKYNVTVNGVDKPDRSYRIDFQFSPDRLFKLVQDGNESVEVQVGFYQQGQPTSDKYGRPLSSFNPWMKTIDPDNLNNSVSGPTGAGRYDDTWTSVWYVGEKDDRGTYFYFTNLPTSEYPDTLYPDHTDGDLEFNIGIADAQQLEPNTNYYYEIVGAKNPNNTKGIFRLSSQRGYRFNHEGLPDSNEYFVFNEEWKNVNESGTNEVLLQAYNNTYNEWYDWRLHEIISQKDSRYANIFAANGYTYSWDRNGLIKLNTGSGFLNTIIDRNWDGWDTSWFNTSTVLGPYSNN